MLGFDTFISKEQSMGQTCSQFGLQRVPRVHPQPACSVLTDRFCQEPAKSRFGGKVAPVIHRRNGVGLALKFKPAEQSETPALDVGVALLVQANGFDAQPSSPSGPSCHEQTDQSKTKPAANIRPKDPAQEFSPR